MSLREEFEARFPVPAGVAWSDEHQNYGWVKKQAFQRTITYRALFTGWKASREALEIELPRVCASDDPFELKRDIAYELELAGVRVKP